MDQDAGPAPSLGLRVAIVAFIAAACLLVLTLLIVVIWGVGWLGGLATFTEDAIPSPDGEWSLVVGVRDAGACGASTRVSIRLADSEDNRDSLALYDGDWVSASWVDARTVDIGGEWRMPFIEHAVDTESDRTTGKDIDRLGYARNRIVPGERIAILSGLFVSCPFNLHGELLSRRGPLASRPRQDLLLRWDGPSAESWRYRFLAAEKPEEVRDWDVVRTGDLLGRSNDGRIEAYWVSDRGWLVMTTKLPGRLGGLIIASGVSFETSDEARQGAGDMWEELDIDGVALPWSAK
ncbi:MAG: hypothetical protein JXA87_03475 [Thermoleophilia bacterium]|nr:hypothetical protein [Thermoleophilia bacterium]